MDLVASGLAKMMLDQIILADTLTPGMISREDLEKEFLKINTILYPLDRKLAVTADEAFNIDR